MRSASPTLCNRVQRVAFLLVALFFSISSLSFGSASAIYISQNAAGSNTGTSCSNAHAASWFNSSANWGSNSGQIGAGTTVNLCGTFTGATGANILTFYGSGSSGSPITLFWQSGAQITSPACTGGNAQNGCISTNGNSWITLDGNGTSPSITNTANGSGLSNQIDSTGVYAHGCNNCEFKNLTITNLYVHNSTSDANCGCGEGISPTGVGYSIHNNTFDQMYIGVDSPYANGDSNINVYNNTVDHVNWGIHFGNNGPYSLSNLSIYSNHVEDMDNWDTTSDAFHHDGIFVVQNDTSASITNIYIYSNLLDGNMSSCSPNSCATAWIFFNTGINGMYVFNNRFHNPAGTATPMVEGGYTGDRNYVFYSNYVDCGGSGIGFGFGPVQGTVVENNAFNNCATYLSTSSVTGTILVDHNVYASDSASESNCNTMKWSDTGGQCYSQYRTSTGFDADSIAQSGSTSVDANDIPTAGSVLIHNGTSNFWNLTSLCVGGLVPLCTDYAGVGRPTTGSNNWDAGAYQYGAGSGSAPAPPTALSASVL
jgi:hypothetical protein